jgi:OOP family OmpA-OmpF porin
MRTWPPLVLCLCLCLAIRPAASRDQAIPTSPRLSIEVRAGDLTIEGTVSSVAHEAILGATASRNFEGKPASMDVTVVPGLPGGWALVTDLTLRSMAETRSGNAEIDATSITIRGFTGDSARFDESLERLQAGMLPAMSLDVHVEEIGQAAPMARQCIELFRTALRGRRIEFQRGTATVNSADYPLLDEIVTIATDCPGSTIGVSGHTDKSGDENANRDLSQARANAVAAYLMAGGVPAYRIEATGLGSSMPLVTDDSIRARQLNRRIEFELRYP